MLPFELCGTDWRMAAHEAGESDKHALFKQWALPHMDYLYTASLYLTRQREEAEDVFQETYLRAFRFFHQFTPGTNCRAWLLTIMHNVFNNRYAQRARAGRMVELESVTYEQEQKRLADGAADQEDPAALFAAGLLDSEMSDALQSLPDEYRATVVLVDIEELTYEEAAAVLGCPIGTVRSRLSRARRCLHAALSSYARDRGYLKGAPTSLDQPPKTGTRL